MTEREAFEQWAASEDFCIHRDETEKYSDYHRATTRWAWQAWQARAVLADRASRSPVVGAVGGEPKPLTDGQLLAMMLAINEERHPEITGPAKMFIHIARRIEAAHGIGVSPTGSGGGEQWIAS